MYCILSEHFTGVFLFFCTILYDFSRSDISEYQTSYNSSEEIKNIFGFFHETKPNLEGGAFREDLAEGELINESFNLSGLNTSIKNSDKNLSNVEKNVSEFTSILKKQNISSSFNNEMSNKSHNSLQISSIKTLLPTKLIETASNLFLGVPEVIHINGTSSIKPRKGVHYSKIVPRKGVDNENEASHISLENQSCFWLSEKECYSDKGMHDWECSCCKESNVFGKNVKQTPVNCKNCKTFNTLSSEGNCKNICCNAISNNFYSISSAQNVYNIYTEYQTAPSANKSQHNLSLTGISEKIMLGRDFSKNTVTKGNNNSESTEKNSRFKPHITKVPYDVESMTKQLNKTQQKIFVPLVVTLFLLPLMGVIIFFLWQKTKDYWNKRYYKRMDFLIDGIYND